MKHAIIETGGKQYRVKEGDVIYVEKLPEEAGAEVTFGNVLAITDDEDGKGDKGSTFGTPFVKGATVTGSVVKNGKAKKIIVYKMRPKKGYRVKQGHRQPYTKVEIKTIGVG
jgi:large subunit ribosomal protein L21